MRGTGVSNQVIYYTCSPLMKYVCFAELEDEGRGIK